MYMYIYLNLSSNNVPKLRNMIWALHSEYYKCELQITKLLKRDNINDLSLCFKEEETCLMSNFNITQASH